MMEKLQKGTKVIIYNIKENNALEGTLIKDTLKHKELEVLKEYDKKTNTIVFTDGKTDYSFTKDELDGNITILGKTNHLELSLSLILLFLFVFVIKILL